MHRRKRCDLSLFQLGLRLLEHLLNEEMLIPVQFHVTIEQKKGVWWRIVQFRSYKNATEDCKAYGQNIQTHCSPTDYASTMMHASTHRKLCLSKRPERAFAN